MHTHQYLVSILYATNHFAFCLPYMLEFSHGFMVFADFKPSVIVHICENLDQALVQLQNMAIHEYKM